MEFKQEPNKIEKARNQKILQDSFLSTLSTIYSIYPNLTMSQHLDGIKRGKGATDGNPKNPNTKFVDTNKWSDEKLVKATEKYLQELEQDPPQLWGQGDDFLSEESINDFYDRNC